MNVLSIQSHVAFGHVGNSAAVFALQRLGHEVWPVHTVQFSNHPGYGAFGGRPMAPADVGDVVRGLDDLGALGECDAVLSGYIGDRETGRAVLDAVARVKSANPDALYLCDPVMGDRETGLYVREGVPDFFKEHAVPAADIVTPNGFELAILTGRRVEDTATARAALDRLRELGPSVAVATGLGAEGDDIETVAVADGTALSVRTPILPTATRPDGAGDLFSAMFLARYLDTRALGAALSHATSAVHAVLRATVEAGVRELRLIDAQGQLAAPSPTFRCAELS